MKSKKISKFEEKYIVNISLSFWRLIISIGILGTIVGIFILLWGIMPISKDSIVKETYPPEEKISVDELKNNVIPELIKEQKKMVKEKPVIISAEEKSYSEALSFLESELPKKYNSKLSKGHWYYPKGKEYWDYYGYSYLREWIVDIKDLDDFLESVYYNIDAISFIDKEKIVKEFLSVIKLFPREKRIDIMKGLASYSTQSVSQSMNNIQLLKKTIPFFSTEDTYFFTTLATFGKNNPRDGFAFIKYVNKIINNFDKDHKVLILDNLIDSYYYYFDYENIGVNKQIKVTDIFLPMLSDFESKYQSKALKQFYIMYFTKNAAREQSILDIEKKYDFDLESSGIKYQMDKENKSKIRIRGLYFIGAGIILIAFFALILVFLSTHKSIKNIELYLSNE